MPLDLTDDKSTLVQVMAWCRQAAIHYLSQCWPRSVSPYGIIRPQWVKTMIWKLIQNSDMTTHSGECRRTSLMRSQHWFRWWLDAIRQQAITWANVDPNTLVLSQSCSESLIWFPPLHGGGWGCEVSCGWHHRQRGKTTTGSALDGVYLISLKYWPI